MQVVLRLNFPLEEVGRETGVVLSVGDDAQQSISWTYADSKTNDGQERDAEVDRAVASLFAARARQEATALNRAGNFPAAQAALAGVAKRIRGYPGRDKEMRSLIADLDRESNDLAAPMAPAALKEMHYRSYASAKTRNSMARPSAASRDRRRPLSERARRRHGERR